MKIFLYYTKIYAKVSKLLDLNPENATGNHGQILLRVSTDKHFLKKTLIAREMLPRTNKSSLFSCDESPPSLSFLHCLNSSTLCHVVTSLSNFQKQITFPEVSHPSLRPSLSLCYSLVLHKVPLFFTKQSFNY